MHSPIFGRRDHVGKIVLVDLDINLEGRCESRDLQIISVSAASGHGAQMGFEDTVDFFLRGRTEGGLCGIYAGILSFGISTLPSARMYVDELLVVCSVFSHILNYTSANLVMVSLVAVDLVRESVEEAIAWR